MGMCLKYEKLTVLHKVIQFTIFLFMRNSNVNSSVYKDGYGGLVEVVYTNNLYT